MARVVLVHIIFAESKQLEMMQ